MNDILPDEMAKWHFVERKAREIFESYGFSEIRTPILERTEVFKRGMGLDTDVVEKQMYTFEDKSGVSLTMRPEATASVLRAVIENGLLGRDPIQKLYSIGPMFRYERPQKGRYRQFHQINVERLGEDSYVSDAETFAMAYDLACSLGLKDVRLEVNSLGCAACRPRYKETLKAFLESRRDRLCADCARRMYTNPLRVLDCKEESCRAAVSDAPLMEEALCVDCREHYAGALETLEALEVQFVKNPRLVRGLDYYTRTTFEMTAASGLGSQNAIAGGGRYDSLVSMLDGPDVSGIGFALGVERLIMLLDEIPNRKKGCFMIVSGEATVQTEALRLMKELRSAGICVEAAPDRSFKAQMRRAGRSGYPFCVIIGEDEIAAGKVGLKDMNTSDQTEVARSGIAAQLLEMFAN